jgi:hypothetical protein
MNLKKTLSYFDFFTFRGVTVLIFSLVLIYSGQNERLNTSSLMLGVFLLSVFTINLVISFILKVILNLNHKKFHFDLNKEIYFAKDQVKITNLYIPAISKLLYLFPTQIEIFIPKRLGGNIKLELNKEFLDNPQIPIAQSKRGQYEIGPIILIFTDCFGFVKTKITYKEKKTINILPDFENLQSISYKFLDKSFKDHKQIRKTISTESLFDIKDYSPMDDMRRINWKQSARSDEKLFVKKPENINLHIQSSLTMFLDNSFLGTHNDFVMDALDKQISIAATLGRFYLLHGSKVKFCYLDNENSVKIYKPLDFNSFLKFLCLTQFNKPNNKKSKRLKHIELENEIVNLHEENLVYIYNSLTNHYRYHESSSSLIKNICVDVKTFVSKSMEKKSKKLHKIFFTKEYFALKNVQAQTKSDQMWVEFIENRNISKNPNTVIIKARDPLNKILNN